MLAAYVVGSVVFVYWCGLMKVSLAGSTAFCRIILIYGLEFGNMTIRGIFVDMFIIFLDTAYLAIL
jgi:hypothetical protein